MKGSGKIIDLSSIQQLKIQSTDVSNVWNVSLPTQPWKFNSAVQERQSIVISLTANLPWRALWLSDWASEDSQGWRLFAYNEQLSPLDDEFSNGAWVLFFFETDPCSSFDISLKPTWPANANAAARTLHDFGADAAIWSWYDDNEWLIVTG